MKFSSFKTFFLTLVLLSVFSTAASSSELQRFSGYRIPVFASKSLAQENVKPIALRTHRAYDFLAKALKGTFPKRPRFTLYILAERDWAKYSDQVFGMPSYDEKKHQLIVAGEPSSFWEDFVNLIHDHAAPETIEKLKAVYGNGGQRIDLSSFFELLSVHELGHAFHLAAGVENFSMPWLQEFYANLALESFIATAEPLSLSTLLTFPKALAGISKSSLPADLIPNTLLSQFNFPGAPGPPGSNDTTPHNYVWFQAKLHMGADEVFRSRADIRCLRYLTTAKYSNVSSDLELADFFRDSGECLAIADWIEQF